MISPCFDDVFDQLQFNVAEVKVGQVDAKRGNVGSAQLPGALYLSAVLRTKEEPSKHTSSVFDLVFNRKLSGSRRRNRVRYVGGRLGLGLSRIPSPHCATQDLAPAVSTIQVSPEFPPPRSPEAIVVRLICNAGKCDTTAGAIDCSYTGSGTAKTFPVQHVQEVLHPGRPSHATRSSAYVYSLQYTRYRRRRAPVCSAEA